MKKEGVFVMKKLFAFILVAIMLMFCGCNTEQTGNVDENIQMAPNMEELKDHIGEYVTGDLISLPRVGLMADEYAKRDTDIPGKELVINAEGIWFDGTFFECAETEKCDSESVSGYYNVGGTDASNLCERDEEVTVFHLCNDSEQKVINLILNGEGKLKLWVTEPYIYIGGYEVVPKGSFSDKRKEMGEWQTDITSLQSYEEPMWVYEDIETVYYKDAGISIAYPQFLDLGKSQINELIKQEATNIFFDTYNGDKTELTLEISYGITFKNKKMMSVVFYGYGDRKGSAHPNRHFYTVNLDMENNRKIYLKDVCKDFDKLKDVIREWNFVFKMQDSPEKEELIKVNEIFTFDNLMGCDEPDSGMYSYFTEDKLGISFSVPHAIGDYKRIEILYNETREIVDPDEIFS